METDRGLRIVSGGHGGVDRAALDVAHARGHGTGVCVDESDAMLVLTQGAGKATRRMGKPCLVIDLDSRDAVETARAWLAYVAPRVLGIAGTRTSGRPGTYGRAYAFLSRVLAKAAA
jgi:hypothetical protein